MELLLDPTGAGPITKHSAHLPIKVRLLTYNFAIIINSGIMASDECYFIPLDDKVSVLAECILVLDDTQRALESKRGDINFLIRELVDLDVKTARLVMHLKLKIMAFKNEARILFELL